MRYLRNALIISFVAALATSAAHAANRNTAGKEEPIPEPMPPGFQVVVTELEGPVFADAQGYTFYKWPKSQHRQGETGEVPGKPTCADNIYRESAGFMSPYPGGFELPEVDTRVSCDRVFPPVLAADDAKAVGKWGITTRLDGRKQWTYDGWSLYTSVLDKKSGDVNGGSAMSFSGDGGSWRHPVVPKPNIPAQFSVHTTITGRMIGTRDDWSVYSYDGDSRNKSNCMGACLDEWTPILAANYARPVGEWTIFERTPGVHQWAFRGKPLYRRNDDAGTGSQNGSDQPGWHNVYTQMAPPPPKGFVLKDTMIGVVLGDANGRTIYEYHCVEDTLDAQLCDHPDTPQAYRIGVCGGGDVDRCVKAFPYVIAPAGAKSGSQLWSTMYVNPKTGKKAKEGDAGALHVWTYRDRPVYTFAGTETYGDKKPQDMLAHAWGEFTGMRNGFRAFVYRDLFGNVQ